MTVQRGQHLVLLATVWGAAAGLWLFSACPAQAQITHGVIAVTNAT